MNEDQACDVVDEEWHNMNMMEKCYAIDPEGNRLLLAEFYNHAGTDRALIDEYLNDQRHEWFERRIATLLKNDA
jgi:hypothetical protein